MSSHQYQIPRSDHIMYPTPITSNAPLPNFRDPPPHQPSLPPQQVVTSISQGDHQRYRIFVDPNNEVHSVGTPGGSGQFLTSHSDSVVYMPTPVGYPASYQLQGSYMQGSDVAGQNVASGSHSALTPIQEEPQPASPCGDGVNSTSRFDRLGDRFVAYVTEMQAMIDYQQRLLQQYQPVPNGSVPDHGAINHAVNMPVRPFSALDASCTHSTPPLQRPSSCVLPPQHPPATPVQFPSLNLPPPPLPPPPVPFVSPQQTHFHYPQYPQYPPYSAIPQQAPVYAPPYAFGGSWSTPPTYNLPGGFHYHTPAPAHTQTLPIPQHAPPAPAQPPVSTMSNCMSLLASVECLRSGLPITALTCWETDMMRVLYTAGLAGHVVCDELADCGGGVDPGSAVPVFAPPLPVNPTAEEHTAFQRWKQLDALAYHLVVSKVDKAILACIPPLPGRTRSICPAHAMMLEIIRVFAPRAYINSHKLVDDLRALSLSNCGRRVDDYLSKWKSGWVQIIHDRTLWGVRDATVQFLHGLPQTFMEFNRSVVESLDHVADSDQAFLLDVIERACSRELTNSLFTRSGVPSASRPPSSTSKSTEVCENCGIVGHTKDLCFKTGGGRAGLAPPRKTRPAPAASANVAACDVDVPSDGDDADGEVDPDVPVGTVPDNLHQRHKEAHIREPVEESQSMGDTVDIADNENEFAEVTQTALAEEAGEEEANSERETEQASQEDVEGVTHKKRDVEEEA
ncbi:hypothetical protein BJ165DRAFT_1521553 [Panaeolus papilionaceus]|nr:hypothetical protein BJ165DRAFT_1521553 [Panaeolus papilionaceus]